MRLSNKVLITLSIIWLLFLGLVYVIGHHYLMKSYIDLEKIEIEKNVNRYHQHVNEVLQAFGALAVDWGYWNDSYEFIEQPNQKFIDENFDYSTFDNLKINLVLFVNKKAKILYGIGSDFTQEQLVPYTKDIEKYLSPESVLVKHTDAIKSVTGLLSLPSGLMMIVAAPVSYSYSGRTKPINGAVIIGRYYSPEVLEKISTSISIPLKLLLLDDIKKDKNLNAIFESTLKSQTGNYTHFLNNKKMNVFSLFRDINNQPIGMVELSLNRNIYFAGVKSTNYYLTFFMVLGLISGVLIWFLLRVLVLKRLENLNKKIVTITTSQDYTHRIKISYNDEISFLATQFNTMMDAVQQSHGQLSHQITLLKESELRLEKLNAQLKEEITERKHAEEKVAALQSKLLLAARRAGMADIASGILHNIGNILNSVVTSIGVIRERTTDDQITKIDNVVGLLNQHHDDLGKFFNENPKAKNIASYLAMVTKLMQEDKEFILNEITMLDKNMSVIKNVVSNQQSASEAVGIVENVDLTNLIEDALAVNRPLYKNTSIEFIKHFKYDKIILIDRVKLLHIVVNLIKNGIESVLACEKPKKTISISILKRNDHHVMIQITDNGVGIDPDNIQKIFNFGFTTKKTGHGFGMHTSANFTKELGGKLSAESQGINQGATITLLLPTSPDKKIIDAFQSALEKNT